MSYRTERKTQLARQIAARFRDLAAIEKMVGKDGKPRHPKDKARIAGHIQRDIAYLQHEAQQMEQPGVCLSYVTAHAGLPAQVMGVGKPTLGRVCTLRYHDAVDAWYAGRPLFGA